MTRVTVMMSDERQPDREGLGLGQESRPSGESWTQSRIDQGPGARLPLSLYSTHSLAPGRAH